VADKAGHVGWAADVDSFAGKKSTKILNASIGHKLMCSVVVKVVLPNSSVSWFKLVFPHIFHFSNFSIFLRTSIFLSYGPPWAHYLGGYQDRLLGGPLGLLDLHCTTPAGVKHKDYGGEVSR
jgi:hypothetical protein